MGRSFAYFYMTASLPKVAVAMAALAVGLMAQPANTILSEKWDGITGNLVTNLTSNAAYPNSPTTRTYPTQYELTTSAGDNYGTRTRGYVTPPTTGNYTFWIACDDNCELWLGTSSNPATATKIAGVTGSGSWTNSREWTKFAEQQSTARSLTAGVQYYIETRHKEGMGGDNLAVGWQGPGITGDAERPIPGSRLAPFILPVAPTITNTTLTANASTASAFSYTITATGTSPITFGASPLPAGLSVNTGTGVISGTATTPGTTNVTLSATNSAGSAPTRTLSISVFTPPTITNSTLTASGTVGTAFPGYTITATGTSPITYGATPLPAGLSLNTSTGAISGTPTTAGTTNVTLSATNGGGSAATRTLVITIAAAPVAPVITNSTLTASGTVGTAFAGYTITASGTTPITFGATPLPAGLSLNTSTGAISGTPTTAGTTNVTLSATNAAGSAPTRTLVITVSAAPVAPAITNSTLTASGVVGSAFAGYTITASGTAPITFAATPLPAGLSLNTSTGVISGTPTTAGTTNVSMTATNSVGTSPAVTLVITVLTLPTITNATLTASGTVGTAFAGYTITATGSTPITFGATPLPAGLSLNTGTGVISGTPTAAGTTNVTLSATNAAGSAPTRTLVITVSSAPVAPVITNSTLTASGVVGVAFAGYTITASGTTPITFAATPLPAGLSLNSSTGVISGTPTETCSTYVSMTATNSAGTSPAVNLFLAVQTLPTITNTILTASGTVGAPFAGYTITASGSSPYIFGATPLPAGLSVNIASGVISGTPTATGTTNVTLSATNGAGSAPTRTLTITISALPPPVITQQPVSVTLAEGLPGTFTVVASSSSPLTYQWKKQGVDIPGATSPSYTIPAAIMPENGTVYTCVVSNGAGSSVTTNPVEMQVLNTNKEYSTVSSAIPLINMNTFYGNESSGDRKTFRVASSNGGSNTGNATSMEVSVAAGYQDAGTVTAASITANDGVNSTESLTGLNINVNKNASSPGSNVAGLKVNVSDPGNLGAYAALFSGGNVGIGTLTPGEALEVVGNLKVGAAMLGRRLELGTEMGDPRGWQFHLDEFTQELILTRGDGATAFRVWPAGFGVPANLTLYNFFNLLGEPLEENGLVTFGSAEFDYLKGIDQTNTIYDAANGPLMAEYTSHLDSRYLLFDETTPGGDPNRVLSSGTNLGNSQFIMESKFGYDDDPQNIFAHSLFATPYMINFELWQGTDLKAGANMGYGGFSTTGSMWFYGDEFDGGGYSEMRNTYIDKDDGLRNSWYANYNNGDTRLFWSAFDKNSLVMAEQMDYAVTEEIPAGSLDYMHANFLDNNGLHLKTYSKRDLQSESVYKSRSTVDIEGATIEMGYVEEDFLTERSMRIGALGLQYSSTVFGFSGATTYIDDFGITTTGAVTADAIHATTVVTTPTWRIPDYVFEEDYQLQSLESVGKFVETHKHLPNVPSAREIKEKGLDLTEMNIKLLEKVEELTLHMIKMDQELKSQKQKNNRLEKSLRKLQSNAKED